MEYVCRVGVLVLVKKKTTLLILFVYKVLLVVEKNECECELEVSIESRRFAKGNLNLCGGGFVWREGEPLITVVLFLVGSKLVLGGRKMVSPTAELQAKHVIGRQATGRPGSCNFFKSVRPVPYLK